MRRGPNGRMRPFSGSHMCDPTDQCMHWSAGRPMRRPEQHSAGGRDFATLCA